MNQTLRDEHGHLIGRIEDHGTYQTIYDEHGHNCGRYDGRNTYDEHGHRIGEGNLLTNLIHF